MTQVHHLEPPFDPDYDHAARRPPANNDAEMAVLGALILDPTLAPQLATELQPSDFYRPTHETIYAAALHVATSATGDIKLDAITLADHLAKTGDLDRVGGAPYLHTLTAAVPITANAGYYATLVRDAARLRAIQELATGFQDIVNRARLDDIEAPFTAAYDKLDAAAARIGPTAAAHVPNRTGLQDLSWILTGQPPAVPDPRWVQRTDGIALFYPGVVNGIFGDPESAKSWLAQIAIVEALAAGGTAAMIDVDHNGANHTAARLLLLGARLTDLADPERFRYYEPEEKPELLAAVTDITTRAPDIVLIDSLGEILPMLGVKSVDNDEISTALRTVCQPPANAGSCVITIDHLPKSTEARVTGYAIGGTAKKRVIRGAYLRAEPKVKPAPGSIGRITLRLEKDTLGGLSEHSPGRYVGEFVLDSTKPHVTTWTITRDGSPITDDGDFRPTDRMEAVSRFVEQNDQCSFREIKEAVPGKDNTLRTAIQLLVNEGFMTTIPGPRRSTLHHSTAMYREDEDAHA